MSKVTILGRGLSQQEIEALRALLAETGTCKAPVGVVETIDEVPSNEDDEVVVLLGTYATCVDAALEADLVSSQVSAKRAIWVWPEGSPESQLPAAAKKYCYSVVAWDAKKLSETVADDDVIRFETPDGTPLAKVDTERNMCVDDDKAKAK